MDTFFPVGYLPAGFWPPGFFPGVAAIPPVVPPVGRDWDIYEDIEARLLALNEFDSVEIGHPDDFDELFPADRFAVALISPDEWGRADDEHVDEELRTGGYTLILSVRHEARGRYQVLDRLNAAVQNVLDGQSLAGLTYQSMTKLSRGTYGAPKDSEQRLTMHGEFRYRVIGHDNHDDSERE